MLVIFFLYIISCFWFIILVYLAFIIIPPSIKSSFLGLLSPVCQLFPRFYIPSLRGELEFLANTPFKSIIFFRLGSSKAALLGLDNLFLIFLFIRFVRLILYLFINKIITLQPSYSTTLPIEDLWPDYIMFSLYSTVLPYSFIPLFSSLFIYGFTLSHRPIFKII